MTELQSGARLQSSLGTKLTRANGNYIVDTLIIARVASINYQLNTVTFTPMSGSIRAQNASQGGNNAVLPMSFAGRNGYGRSYGEVEPIVVGDIILVGYVDSSNANPIVIGRYPDAAIAKEVTAQRSPSYAPDDVDTYAQSHRKLTVYPDQTYSLHDGSGRMELTFSGNSFVLVNQETDVPSHATDDGNMPVNETNLAGHFDGAWEERTPLDRHAPEIVLRHNGTLDKDGNKDQHELYLYISQDGTYRTSIMNDDEPWRAYFEQGKNGSLKLRRQEDSKLFGTGTKTSEIGIDDNGNVTVRSQSTGMVLKPDGIYNLDGTSFTADADLSGVEKKIADLNSTVVENGKKVTTQFEIQDGKISSKVSSDELVDSLGNQINTYGKQLSETTATLNGYKNTLHAMSADGTIDDTELTTLKSIWSDLATAYTLLVTNADKYGVDHSGLDSGYNDLSAYANSIITTGGGVIDTTEFNSKFDTYINSDLAVNTAVYTAIMDSVAPYGVTVRKLSTDIEQTDAKIEANAKEIDKQGGRLTTAEANLAITAHEISSKVSSSDVAAAVSNSVYGTSTGHINLYVKRDSTSNKALSNGVVVDYAGAYVSDYIATDPNIKYMLYTDSTLGNTTLSYAWYDSNKEYISGDSKVSDYDMEYTLTPPSNTAYIRVSINNATNMMLERGYIKSGYIQAYVDAYASGNTQTVIDRAKGDQSSAQGLYDTANSNKSTEPGKISGLVSDGVLTSDERSALQTYLTNYSSLYNVDHDLSQVYTVTDSSYTTALNMLTGYIKPLLDSSSTTIDGDHAMSLFNQYYTERSGFLSQVLSIAKGNVNSNISQAQNDIDNLQATTTKKFSEIEQTSGEIKQTVSEVTTTANNASDKINNLQVGGTNLLPNTIDFSSWQMSSGVSIDSTIYPEVAHYPSFTAGSADIDFLQYASLTSLVANTTYTFSFSAKGSGNLNVLIYPNVSASDSTDNFHQYALTSTYQKYSFTFTTSSNISGTKNVLFRNSKGNALEAYITQVKLEQGNIATDWSPAPNDGLGIKSTTIMYQLGDSDTTPPDGTWLEAVPTLVKGLYLWTRTTLIYTDNSSESIYSVTYIAKDGATGATGATGADGISPINLVIDSSNGYQFKNNIINTTFTAILYQDNKEIDSDGTKFAYVWSKTNADGTADTAWNLAHQTSQKSITITSSDVLRRATFDCTAESLN